jgi:hypothetical protein
MSGQTQGVKSPPLRGYRRRKTVLDLNVPPIDGRDDEGTSTTRIEPPQGVQASHQRNGQGPSLPPPTIDVDAIDDDVIESSPRAFAQVLSLQLNLRESLLLSYYFFLLLLFNFRLRTIPGGLWSLM